MAADRCALTVYFEGPFWVGLFERWEGESYCVSKLTFGPEPRDAEVWERVLREFDRLPFSPGIPSERREEPANPKRARREARRQMEGDQGPAGPGPAARGRKAGPPGKIPGGAGGGGSGALPPAAEKTPGEAPGTLSASPDKGKARRRRAFFVGRSGEFPSGNPKLRDRWWWKPGEGCYPGGRRAAETARKKGGDLF